MNFNLLACIALLLSGITFSSYASKTFKGELGVISGTLSVDKGTVYGFQVKARDITHRITYTVFTRSGKYQIPNLLSGSYEVRVVQKGFQSPTHKVELETGQHQTLDLELTAITAPPSQAPWLSPDRSDVEMVDYDQLYPPGPGRDALESACMSCHGRFIFHRQAWPEEVWQYHSDRMSAPGGNIPHLSEHTKSIVVSYLSKNFGPTSAHRELKLDNFQVDEETVSKAIYIEYDLVPPKDGKRRLHDPYPSLDGTVWFTDTGANSIFQLNPREPDFEKRLKDYPTPTPQAGLHGLVIDTRGHVYWSEMLGGHLGEFNPKTGKFTSHKFPTSGAMLQVIVDSQDNIWYNLARGNKIGKLDAETRQITQWDIPTEGSFPYGMIADQKDRIWWSAIAQHRIGSFEPKTQKLTEYLTPTQPSGPRRLSVDSQGKIWVAYFFGQALGVFDPKSGKWKEYRYPLKYSQGYDARTDANDNVWITESTYDSLVKFDQKSQQFSYYPLPQTGGLPGVPKIEIDPEGTIWFGYRDSPRITAVAFQPEGNFLGK
jgi:virginiamycin B lyase